MNTFEKGQVRILVYKDESEDIWYGTALELNLTIDGDDRNTVLLELDRAIKDYVISARDIGSVELLNQNPDPDLSALWEARIQNRLEEVKSPYTPYIAATEALAYT